MKSLLDIGRDHHPGSDKLDHAYLPLYDERLSPLREKEITFMEMGMWFGSSLRIWREYFTKAKVIGVDCNFNHLRGGFDRIEKEKGDIADVTFLQSLVDKYAPFDVIVDDASHIAEQQLVSLQFLWPHVKVGGYYFIEDLTHPPAGLTYKLIQSGKLDLPDVAKHELIKTSDFTYSTIGILQKGVKDDKV